MKDRGVDILNNEDELIPGKLSRETDPSLKERGPAEAASTFLFNAIYSVSKAAINCSPRARLFPPIADNKKGVHCFVIKYS